MVLWPAWVITVSLLSSASHLWLLTWQICLMCQKKCGPHSFPPTPVDSDHQGDYIWTWCCYAISFPFELPVAGHEAPYLPSAQFLLNYTCCCCCLASTHSVLLLLMSRLYRPLWSLYMGVFVGVYVEFCSRCGVVPDIHSYYLPPGSFCLYYHTATLHSLCKNTFLVWELCRTCGDPGHWIRAWLQVCIPSFLLFLLCVCVLGIGAWWVLYPSLNWIHSLGTAIVTCPWHFTFTMLFVGFF